MVSPYLTTDDGRWTMSFHLSWFVVRVLSSTKMFTQLTNTNKQSVGSDNSNHYNSGVGLALHL
jgi:hypothetical protein